MAGRLWFGSLLCCLLCVLVLVESARPSWLGCRRKSDAVKRLETTLKGRFVGQPYALRELLWFLPAHLESEDPSGPLVLSFHGDTGTGKTLVADLIAEALFGDVHSHSYLRVNLNDWARYDEAAVGRLNRRLTSQHEICERSLVLLDEVRAAAPEMMAHLRPFLDTATRDYKGFVFVLTSNTAIKALEGLVAAHGGVDSPQLGTLGRLEVEGAIRKGLEESEDPRELRVYYPLLYSGLLRLVAFFPMGKETVSLCIRHHLEEAMRLQVESGRVAELWSRDMDGLVSAVADASLQENPEVPGSVMFACKNTAQSTKTPVQNALRVLEEAERLHGHHDETFWSGISRTFVGGKSPYEVPLARSHVHLSVTRTPSGLMAFSAKKEVSKSSEL